MKTVRTTFLPSQKNRSVYFDAEEVDRYFEKTQGRKATTSQKEHHQHWQIIINAAYNDGYKDGIADALKGTAGEVGVER